MLGETTVTQDFYEAVCNHNPSSFKNPKHPVERVSWIDVVRWCNQLSELKGLVPAYDFVEVDGRTQIQWNQVSNGYRLPTEAEWEYASRSGTEFTYSGSNRPDEVAWFGSSRRREGQKTYEVAQKHPNSWGFYDLSGNIWEWCWDDMRQYTSEDMIDHIL